MATQVRADALSLFQAHSLARSGAVVLKRSIEIPTYTPPALPLAPQSLIW